MSDPDAARARRWQDMTHAQLYEMVHRDPQQSTGDSAADLWKQLHGVFDDHDQRMARAVAVSSAGWAGAAADAVMRASQTTSNWVRDAMGDVSTTLDAVSRQREHATTLYNTIPAPVATTAPAAQGVIADNTVPAATSGPAAADAQNQAELARDAMRRYADNSLITRQQLAFWTVPPTSVVVGSDGGDRTTVRGGGATAPVGAAAAPHPAEVAVRAPTPGATGPATSVHHAAASGGGGEPPITEAAAGAGRPGAVAVSGSGSTPGARPAEPSAAGVSRHGVDQAAAVGLPGSRAPREVANTRGLAPGAGGRGTRPLPRRVDAPPGPGGPSTWRELTAREGGALRAVPPRAVDPIIGTPTEATPSRSGVAARTATGGQGPSTLMPPALGGGRDSSRTHRRPDYLVDGSVFADERWFTAAVMTPDDPLPGDSPFDR